MYGNRCFLALSSFERFVLHPGYSVFKIYMMPENVPS